MIYRSSPFAPTYDCPLELTPEPIRAIIRAWEKQSLSFATLTSNASVPKDKEGIFSLTNTGEIIRLTSNDPQLSPVGYLWKNLSEFPYIAGATRGVRSDHEPHYHNAWEVYYVLDGLGLTLAQDRYQRLRTGQYFVIPPNTIHNTPILSEGLSVLYWMPQNAYLDSIQYYWRHNAPQTPEILAQFDAVDSIRARDLGLGPYCGAI